MTYVLPIAGTFYVPPQYVTALAAMPPQLGDFARGQRAVRGFGGVHVRDNVFIENSFHSP